MNYDAKIELRGATEDDLITADLSASAGTIASLLRGLANEIDPPQPFRPPLHGGVVGARGGIMTNGSTDVSEVTRVASVGGHSPTLDSVQVF